MIRPAVTAFALLVATGAAAQSNSDEPRRYRVSVGPQFTPNYPGADGVRVSPFFDLSITRGDKPFDYEAADESFSLPMIRLGALELGPGANFQGNRRRKHTSDLGVDEVGTTIELGGYAQLWVTPQVRFRGEVRQGVGGHKGLVSNIGVDYVARDGDKWMLGIGPRVTLSDAKYRRAYFGVNGAAAARTGLPVFDADGSAVHAIGGAATLNYQFTPRWGIYAYGKYDRLTGDGSDSPITRAVGSPNQFSGGAALSFTFGRGVR